MVFYYSNSNKQRYIYWKCKRKGKLNQNITLFPDFQDYKYEFEKYGNFLTMIIQQVSPIPWFLCSEDKGLQTWRQFILFGAQEQTPFDKILVFYYSHNIQPVWPEKGGRIHVPSFYGVLSFSIICSALPNPYLSEYLFWFILKKHNCL